MTHPQLRLELPEVDPPSGLAGHLVRRVVTWTLASIGSLVTIAIGVASTASATLSVRASGTMEPARVWAVRAQEAGFISQLLASTGDSVRKGQRIAFIDSLALTTENLQVESALREHSISLRRAEASLPTELRQRGQRVAQAEAKLIQARAGLRERLTMFGVAGDERAVRRTYIIGTHIEIDRAFAEVDIAESEVRAATAESEAPRIGPLEVSREANALADARRRRALLRTRISRLALSSPANGFIVTAHTEHMLGIEVRPGDVVLEVAEHGQWKAVLRVSEQGVQDIAVGDRVVIELLALRRTGSRRIQGVVQFVAPSPIALRDEAKMASVVQYEVTVQVDSSQLRQIDVGVVRPGLSVDARIVRKSGRIITLIGDYFSDQFRGPR